MVIISHDRHFLNQVCTHMADLDYNQIKIWPGNYDDFMLASTQARERMSAANAKAKDRISDLQEFVRRFSANASKARQATSRQKMIEKIKIEEMKPSSRQNPYIRFEQEKKLHRQPLSVEGLSFTYPDSTAPVLKNISFNMEPGERIAVIGANGVGKTTLMRCLVGELQADQRQDSLVGEREARLHAAGPSGRLCRGCGPAHLAESMEGADATTSRSCVPRSDACCSPATTARSQ